MAEEKETGLYSGFEKSSSKEIQDACSYLSLTEASHVTTPVFNGAGRDLECVTSSDTVYQRISTKCREPELNEDRFVNSRAFLMIGTIFFLYTLIYIYIHMHLNYIYIHEFELYSTLPLSSRFQAALSQDSVTKNSLAVAFFWVVLWC